MAHLANAIYLCGMLLSPILVTKSEKIFDQLGVPAAMRNYETATKFGSLSQGESRQRRSALPAA
jgi:methionyl-tRNA synthetase